MNLLNDKELNSKIEALESSYEQHWYEYYIKTPSYKLNEFLNDTWASKIERKAMERILKERGAK